VGQGQPVELEPFVERFGVSGALITGVDLVRGLAVMMGMRLSEVPGATGYIDPGYASEGEATEPQPFSEIAARKTPVFNPEHQFMEVFFRR
jgi:2,3-bisphosphoglycerate-independent phosphoglycerate mutase